MSDRADAVFLIVSGTVLAGAFMHSVVSGPTVVNLIVAALAFVWPTKMLVVGICRLARRRNESEKMSG
jgi:hypothetical protein